MPHQNAQRKAKGRRSSPCIERWEQSAGHYSRAIISRTRVPGDSAGSTAMKILNLPSFPNSVAAAEIEKLSYRITVASRRHRRLLGFFSEAVIGDQIKRHGKAWQLLESKRRPLAWILLGEFNGPAYITVAFGFCFENSTAFSFSRN